MIKEKFTVVKNGSGIHVQLIRVKVWLALARWAPHSAFSHLQHRLFCKEQVLYFFFFSSYKVQQAISKKPLRMESQQWSPLVKWGQFLLRGPSTAKRCPSPPLYVLWQSRHSQLNPSFLFVCSSDGCDKTSKQPPLTVLHNDFWNRRFKNPPNGPAHIQYKINLPWL